MFKTKKEIENSIRSSNTIEELRTTLLELLEIMPEDDFPSYKEYELLKERVTIIEGEKE